MKDKIDEIATYIKDKNISDLYRGMNEFKRGYQTSNLVKDENGNLLADSHNILNRWKKCFSQLLNVSRSRPISRVTMGRVQDEGGAQGHHLPLTWR
jgi:hypothetical protein